MRCVRVLPADLKINRSVSGCRSLMLAISGKRSFAVKAGLRSGTTSERRDHLSNFLACKLVSSGPQMHVQCEAWCEAFCYACTPSIAVIHVARDAYKPGRKGQVKQAKEQ